MQGHDRPTKMPGNQEISSQYLTIFHQSGFGIRKACTGGKITANDSTKSLANYNKLYRNLATCPPAQTRSRRQKCLILLLCRSIYGRTGVDEFELVPGWLKPRLIIIFTSTRRFCKRPSAVVLSATESVLP